MTTLTESDVEQVALEWLASVGWQVAHGPDIAPDRPGAERNRLWRGGAGAAAARCPGRVEPAPARRGAGRCLSQADPPGGGHAGGPKPRFPPHAGGGCDGGVPGECGRHSRGAGKGHRLRRTRQQRLAGGQPVHRHRESAHPPTRRGAVCQRPAAGHHRAQEPGG